jgi:DNA helicase HerA-like ATPase
MGKTTLAKNYAQFLAKNRNVTILDQTGEYIRKIGFPEFSETQLSTPFISVNEPKLSEIIFPKFALEFLKSVMLKGRDEYNIGIPFSRVIVIDEAHQFIPEPAIIGHGAKGREESINIGYLMMQVRKFGISIILISQRTAVIAKSALSQCENIIAFKSTDQTGLDYLESIVGGQVREILPRLNQGEALVFGPAFSADCPVIIKVKMD